jgi:hypothetical protein
MVESDLLVSLTLWLLILLAMVECFSPVCGAGTAGREHGLPDS